MVAVPATLVPVFSRERLLQVARTLPADVQVLAQLGTMLQDVNTELDEIAALLRRDAMLAARIVRISNSPMFCGGGSIGSVEEAVNRVGFGEILKLVGTASTARLAQRPLELYQIDALKLRNNMLCCAFAAEALARPAGLDPRPAYVAGLLRPLGLIVLDTAGRGHNPLTAPYQPGRWATYTEWEREKWGMVSGDVTAMILDEWRFHPDVSRGTKTHYLAQEEDYARPLAVLLNVACGLVDRLGLTFAGEESWWKITDDKCQAAGLTADDLDPATAHTELAFLAAKAALEV
jgi:HD-like signal output (HDOD) protein